MSIGIKSVDLSSPREIEGLLQSHGLTVKKRFGQNFLINRDARRRIVDALGISGGEVVWEIGPGLGSLTVDLARKRIRLIAFEIDHGFVRLLEDAFREESGITIVEGDFMKTWPGIHESSGTPDIIVGNLPYSSASAIFVSLIEGGLKARRIVCTVQKEAAARMTARPGAPEYSSFSVLCALSWRIERLGDLQPGSFYPSPRVRSTILSMEPQERSPAVSTQMLLPGVRALFAGRRKTLKNNLKSALSDNKALLRELSAEAEQNGFDLSRRPETLEPQMVEGLVAILGKYIDWSKIRLPA